MYLTIDTYNNIDDLPEEKNFSKPYLIKGGCKNMAIFKKENILDYINETLGDIEFETEIYDNKKDMTETKVSNYENIKINDTINMIKKGKICYIADVDLQEYEVPTTFTDQFYSEYDDKFKNNRKLLFYGKDTISGCHIHSSNDYFLNQIVGNKIVYMFALNDNVEMDGIFSERFNFTKNKFSEMDHSKLTIYEAKMEPGDTLIIPPWWLHTVEGFGNTVSITKTYDRTDWWLIDKPYILFGTLYSYLNSFINNINNVLCITYYELQYAYYNYDYIIISLLSENNTTLFLIIICIILFFIYRIVKKI